MKIVFLRHGVTEWNLTRRLQGRSDIPLAEEGRIAAEKAGESLKKISIDAVFCSPLLRTRQTAEALGLSLPIWYDDRLMEWNFGDLEGRFVPDVQTEFLSLWHRGVPKSFGAETFEELVVRVSEFLSDAKAQYPNGTVLVISHGGISAAFHVALFGYPRDDQLQKYCLPNTTPFLFDTEDLPKELK